MKTETYTDHDLIIPVLAKKGVLQNGDPNPTCLVEVSVRDQDVRLRVGPRDWQWDRKTGRLIGKGTTLSVPKSSGE